MKVWLLLWSNGYGRHGLISIHESEEKARKALEKQPVLPSVYYDIEEWEVN